MTDSENDQTFEIAQFDKIMNFQNLKLWKIRKNIKYYNLVNSKIINFTIWKISILPFEKLLNYANNLWIMKK